MGEAIISMDELLFETRREGKLWLEEKLLNGPPGDRKSIAQDPNKRNGRRVTYVCKTMMKDGKWLGLQQPNFVCPQRADETRMPYMRRKSHEAEEYATSQGCCPFKAVQVQESATSDFPGKWRFTDCDVDGALHKWIPHSVNCSGPPLKISALLCNDRPLLCT